MPLTEAGALLGASGLNLLGSVGTGLLSNAFSAAAQKRAFNYTKALQEFQNMFIERMSNTAHQREVQDLRAAGLNPVLSATGGNGATSGAFGTASQSPVAGQPSDVDLLGSAIAVKQLKNDTERRKAEVEELTTRKDLNKSSAEYNTLKGTIEKALADNTIENNTARTLAEIRNLDEQIKWIGYNSVTNRISANASARDAEASYRMSDYHHGRMKYQNMNDYWNGHNSYYDYKEKARIYGITGGDTPNSASSFFIKNKYYKPFAIGL